MAIRHVAWLRFTDGVSRDRIEKHMAACRALVGRVPVVQNLECGPNLTDRAGGFTHCIIVSLPDRAALDAYLGHPDHVPVAEALMGDVAELRVMDVQVCQDAQSRGPQTSGLFHFTNADLRSATPHLHWASTNG